MLQWIVCSVLAGFIVLLFCAARGRWFSRLRRGFAVMLAIALAGAGAITALVLGTWAKTEASHIVVDQQVNMLSEIGGLAEQRLRQDITTAVTKLGNISDASLVAQASKQPEQVTQLLNTLQAFNRRLLQISVLDRDGKLLVTDARDAAKEPVNRVAVAYALEGKTYISSPYVSDTFNREVIALSAPCIDKDGTIAGVMTMRYDLQTAMKEMIAGFQFGKTGRAVFADFKGRVMAHPDADHIGTSISDQPIFQAAQTTGVGSLTAVNQSGVERLYIFRQIASPATEGGSPIILISEMDNAEAMAPVIHLEKILAIATAAVVLIWTAVALGLARILMRPLRDLLGVIARVTKGDLQVRTPLTGQDEIGQFASAFNDMIKGLQERERVKKVFGRYVTTQVAERVLQAQSEHDLTSQKKRVTILFADIRNFTTMSEKMAPEQVVEFLNDYFSEMVDAVIEHGGVLDKFIGDGIMASFGAMDDAPNPETRAVLAGLRMKAKLAKLNGQRSVAGKDPIHIGIGIHTDDVVVGNIGTKDRAEYTVIGDGVNTCSRVEAANKDLGTTLLITQATHQHLGEGFHCRAMGQTTLKGKSNVPPLFEVLSWQSTAKAA
ncbi:MAG TPA: adenylate/guanylate cyclase domain-containing protein [Tepidisphaeraceae bacterium]|jgi:class 3 adenylate cyclase|nr:adenylate/guanylate cyclase domain-containing protein [Tepidisphaeraceae bacterium]